MNNVKSIVLQSADGSSNSQRISGLMYRIVQTTSLDGKNLLKLIPLSNSTAHYIPAVPLPISTSSSFTKLNMISVATTNCSSQKRCLPLLQTTNAGRFLIAPVGNSEAVEAPVSNSKVPPASLSQEKVLAAPTAAPLQCPSLAALTLSGLPIQKAKPVAISATVKESCSPKTTTLHNPTIQEIQTSSTLPVEKFINKVNLLRRAIQKTYSSPSLAPDEMAYKITTVTVHGPAVQKTKASSTLPEVILTPQLAKVTLPNASEQGTLQSPTPTEDQKTFMVFKNPILPSGHYLQIPANAEVKSVPASLLPPAVQQKILACNLANWSQSAQPSPTVIYVCPVNTVKTIAKHVPNIQPKNMVEVPTILIASDDPVISSPSPASSAVVSNNEPSVSQDPSLKLAVKNTDYSSHCLVPVKSSNNLASKILKNLANQQLTKGGILSLLPPPSHTETEAGLFPPWKDNAMVIDNGKIYLVMQKNSGSSSPGPETVSTSGDCPERENTSPIVLSQTNLQIKIKEEPEDPDFEPIEQKENQRERCPTDGSNTQKPHQRRGIPSECEHMDPVCRMLGEETDGQLLKKAGIRTNLQICLTRISQKQLEQWEKSSSPAISEAQESPDQQIKKVDDITTAITNKKIQDIANLMVVKKEEPIDPGYYAHHTKEMEIKVEPKSPVKRKSESINCSMAVKKQRLKRLFSNCESEHAYSCLPVYSTEASPLSTAVTSHIDSHSKQEALAGTTKPSMAPEKCLIMESSTIAGIDNANGLQLAPRAGPAPSISSFSIGHSFATDISTARTSTLPLNVDETARDEKIRRLKEILKEKEAALEAIRKKMIKAKSPSKTNVKLALNMLIIKKQPDKKKTLNRKSEHAYSCLREENVHVSPRSSSLNSRSEPNVTESCNSVTHCAAANKVLDLSSISEVTPPPSNVDRTAREEKIRRLKAILKAKEAALETIRKSKKVSIQL